MNLLLPVLLPLAAGLLLWLVRPLGDNARARTALTSAVLAAEVLLVVRLLAGPDESCYVWTLTSSLNIYLHLDAMGRLFAGLTACLWLISGVFSFRYMAHEGRERVYYAAYLGTLGVLLGLDFSGNLITFYLFYELMTLLSFLLVVHSRTHEAVMAGLKYLFFSIAGAFAALLGIFFLYDMCLSITFRPGGILPSNLTPTEAARVLRLAMCMIVGFGVKAGMFPLHGWLPAAHPVAPAPASAVLSGLITKAGVLALIRLVYYVIGPDMLRGTWVQRVWLASTLITVFMGSMLAFFEPVLKRRLAYSTVSQVSYVLFGLALLQPTALTGALTHLVFHAVIKTGLFLAAGAIILRTGRTRVDELRGLGRRMPVTVLCFAVYALGLVGIPPFSGFFSKWQLATGALDAGVGVFGWLGPVVLLVSALLTAGYLFPLPVRGFFPGAHPDEAPPCEAPADMTLPLVLLAAVTLVLGVWSGPLGSYASALAAALV